MKVCPTCGTEYPLSERFCPRDGMALRSASPTADLLGQIVAERFHIVKKLGEGGMGTVYLADHRFLRRPCAVKLIRPDQARDEATMARFEREVQAAAGLTHPNTVQIYDYGYAEDGTKESRSSSRLDGKRTVTLEVRRQTGANTIDVIEGVGSLVDSPGSTPATSSFSGCHAAACRWLPKWPRHSTLPLTSSSSANLACRFSPRLPWARSGKAGCGFSMGS